MKERPLLLGAPMVRATLDDLKTNTRRIIKPEFERIWGQGYPSKQGFECINPGHPWKDAFGVEVDIPTADNRWKTIWCPYGKIGDRLWVREAWKTSVCCDSRKPSEMEKPGLGYGWPIWYGADNGQVTWRGSKTGGEGFVTPGRYRHARFMPRWASRLTLEITDIRVECLNDISEQDAIAEGSREPSLVPIVGASWSEKDVFAKLWEHINGAGSWKENPYVWVIAFQRVEVNG